ncbi:MAG: diguanylate cyclase (GGDEF)-like protein [Limisphaerales bacterium]|jgi:diguanylate cyclase (GGDEF)-like protein
MSVAADKTGQCILVAEDSPTESLALRNILRYGGHEPIITRSGDEALKALGKNQVDLIISDINMPGMSGYELCSAIKEDAKRNHIPVILLTTLSSPLSILAGLKARADYYLTKPYTRDFLLRSVTELFVHPPGAPEPPETPLDVFVEGDEHQVTAGRRQMVNLLFSTYDSAVRQNNQLIETQAELHDRNQQLREQQEQLRIANEQLSELARTDGLTGLNNHRAFKERLEDEYNRSARYELPLSLMMLDVDKFKIFNDTYGHPAGDEVLKIVATCLTKATRSTDFVARYGGEEFVVILPFTQRDVVLGLAERVRAEIESVSWEQRAITVSIGVGTMTSDVKTPADLVALSDEALYHSKLTGRNRVTHMNELPHKDPAATVVG